MSANATLLPAKAKSESASAIPATDGFAMWDGSK